MRFKYYYVRQKELYIYPLNVPEILKGQLHFKYKDTIGRSRDLQGKPMQLCIASMH